jgi:protein-tyrosine phosphatase
MIDLHGRYLPWVGEGATSLDEALGLLRAAEADGVRLVVLAPTVDPRAAPVARADLERKFTAFAQVAARRGLRVELRLGAELVHGPGAVEAIERGQIPFVGESDGRQVALLRWAEDFVPIGAISATQAMLSRGVLPMLAHPERNPGVVRAPSTLDLFLCDGCLVQVDAGSILGWYGPQVRDAAFRLVEAGMVTVVASGAPGADGRPPSLRAAREALVQRFGEATASRLVELNPSLLVRAGRSPTQPSRGAPKAASVVA